MLLDKADNKLTKMTNTNKRVTISIVPLSDVLSIKELILDPSFYIENGQNAFKKISNLIEKYKSVQVKNLIKQQKLQNVKIQESYEGTTNVKRYVINCIKGDGVLNLKNGAFRILKKPELIVNPCQKKVMVLDNKKVKKHGINMYYLSALFNSDLYKQLIKFLFYNYSYKMELPIIILNNSTVKKISKKEKNRLNQIDQTYKKIKTLENKQLIDL